MILLLFVFGLSLVFGFYFLAAGVLRLPSMGAARAIAERGSGKQKVTGFLEDGMDHLSAFWQDISLWMSTESGGWAIS